MIDAIRLWTLSTILLLLIASYALADDNSEDEPNDSFDKANNVKGKYVRGYVNLGDYLDSDYYKIIVPSNRILNISIYQQSGGYIDFMLYNIDRQFVEGSFLRTSGKGDQLFYNVVNNADREKEYYVVINGHGEYKLDFAKEVAKIEVKEIFNEKTIPFLLFGIGFCIVFFIIIITIKKAVDKSMKIKPKNKLIDIEERDTDPEIFNYPK